MGINRRIECRPSFANPSEVSASASTTAINHSGRFGALGLIGVGGVCAKPRAVVVTVIVVLEPGVTDVGLNVAPAPVGNPLALNVMLFANAPPTVAVLIVNVVGLPAATVCVVGVGVTEKSVIVKLIAAVVPPPGVGVNTVIAAVPPVAMSAAVIAAVNEVALTNVVTRALPFTCATELLTKFVPVNVIVNPLPPAAIKLGEIAVSVGTGFGGLMVNVSEFDVMFPTALPDDARHSLR